MRENRLTISDEAYRQRINELDVRYRQSQIKAAASVNTEMLLFYW